MNIEERINKIISDQLYCKSEEIRPEQNLSKDLDADSLDHVELGMGAEEEFGIHIPVLEWEEVETVGQMYECVKRHLKEAA